MKVKIKKINPNALTPSQAHSDDFGYDVCAMSEEEVAPGVWKYGLGVAFEIVRPYPANVHLSIDLRPRSSVWKTGMVLSNCCGTIDEGYRGEVSAVFYHVMPNMPRYKVGDKIGQIKIGSSFPIKFVESDELTITDRGDKGYGSSGK